MSEIEKKYIGYTLDFVVIPFSSKNKMGFFQQLWEVGLAENDLQKATQWSPALDPSPTLVHYILHSLCGWQGLYKVIRFLLKSVPSA